MTRDTPLSRNIRIRGHYNLDVKQLTVCFRPETDITPLHPPPEAVARQESGLWLGWQHSQRIGDQFFEALRQRFRRGIDYALRLLR